MIERVWELTHEENGPSSQARLVEGEGFTSYFVLGTVEYKYKKYSTC
jgi:hypothetical protein